MWIRDHRKYVVALTLHDTGEDVRIMTDYIVSLMEERTIVHKGNNKTLETSTLVLTSTGLTYRVIESPKLILDKMHGKW